MTRLIRRSRFGVPKTLISEEGHNLLLRVLRMANLFIGPKRLRNAALLDLRQKSFDSRHVPAIRSRHQIRLSPSSCLSFGSDTRQYMPLGGPAMTRPDGVVMGYVPAP